jgi:membrane-bound ClpP family serine protease
MNGTKINWDYLGIATSVACAIHCALLPLILTALPIFGINIIHNSFFEWGMIALAFCVGAYSLIHSYVKHHQNKIPIAIFSTGSIFLILKQVIPQYEYLLLAFAVLFIVSAHVLNFRHCSHTKKCDSDGHIH